MLKLDEFESLFRSALHEVFHLQRPALERVLVVGDRGMDHVADLRQRVAAWLEPIEGGKQIDWVTVSGRDWADGDAPPIPTLLAKIAELEPHLLVCERHLLGAIRDLPHTLGSVVDTLTQAQPVPVLLMPIGPLPASTGTVLAVTDRMTGQDGLVSWAVRMAAPGGTLVLAHIEDDTCVDRALDAISRIRDLDSDVARAELANKLMDGPRHYLGSIQAVLAEHGITDRVVAVVRKGHALSDYSSLIDEHSVDLVVIDTKDDRQIAMHGLAHALAVEIRQRPLLML